MAHLPLVFHVLGVVLFFGGMIAGWIWMSQIVAAADAKIAAFGLKALRRQNMWTLHLGSVLVLISGLWMSMAARVPLRLSTNHWLLYSVVLFFMVLAVSTGMQGPIVKRLLILAGSNDADYAVVSRSIAGRLNLLSMFSVLLMLVILTLMVLKP
jgi:uncharacterized membrane protein